MDVSGIAGQQAVNQTKMSLSMIKSAANAEKAVADMISQSVDASRGRNLDIKV